MYQRQGWDVFPTDDVYNSVIDSKQLRNTMKWFTKNKKDINYQRTIKYFTAFKQHVHVL